jgi:hypothetical protein
MHEVQNIVVDKLADRAYNLQEVLPAGALDENQKECTSQYMEENARGEN